MLVSSSELLPGDRILGFPAWDKPPWNRSNRPNEIGAVVTEVTQEYLSHIPQVKFQGNFTPGSFIAAVMVEIERA